MALQRLTEIATENSGSQYTCVVIAREAGDYTVATSMAPPEACQMHENPIPIRAISDPLQRAIIHHALNTKERIYYEDVSTEPRFSSEAQQSAYRSVICLPIFSNRGQTFGAVYLASKYAFSPNTVAILTLLCQQASIGIANALLFRSVQAGTRENLKMIAAQRDALEAARKSREDALKATKIKSNFLASMSHELRTPFSSFYGLLDILSGTELNPGQSEIVQTAKQSCELLLKIIDSILDYSKLEASALKLEYSGFAMENMIADCMELLLPMAAKKLDLSYNIEPDVPPSRVDELTHVLHSLSNEVLKDTKVIHLFTPTTDNLAGTPMLRNDAVAGIVRITKPPRQARLLHTLANLKNLPSQAPLAPLLSLSAIKEEEALARRSLYGNVLVAEDNPVAQKLLIAQLQRYQINVVATSNGEEAIAEWEKHEPGYFSVALFDHHMPICDGVEASKRLRIMENKRRVPMVLPIIALSADCQESTKQLCLSAGMNAFFSKPLKKGDLLTLLSSFGESLTRTNPDPETPSPSPPP
ncbi:hypothetical hybrid sensor histidine kinase [Postia placenta Mad-698-R]|nr:hypothetical hybrid sensor histidine kinase [Postia placenta Mad-698-R]